MSQNNDTILLDDRGLVAEYLLDGNANDTSGNGNNGTATNVTYTKTDRDYQSQCGVFNGTSSKIDTTFAWLTNNFSVSIELTKWDSDWVAFSMHNAWCSIYPDWTVGASFYDWADRYISSSTWYVADSNLHHLVWVKTSTNGQALWLDWVKVAENTSHNGTLSTYTGTPWIGYFRSFNANYTSWNIQTVRIFNAALSEKEIRNRYLHSLRMAGGSSLQWLSDGLVSYLDSSDGNELSDIVWGKDATKVSGTATTDNLGFTRAITNPNYTFPSITYTNVYSYENSGAGWGLVANPSGIYVTARGFTAINRTTTFRLALFFNRALSASEQTAWADILAKRYVLPFDVDGRKWLPPQLKANCKLWLTGDYANLTSRLQDTSFYNDANLVRYYKMDDLTEKNGNTLTNNGCTATAGKFWWAYSSWTGNTTKWMQNLTLTWINGWACTISAWIKVNGTQPSDLSCAVNENCPSTSPYVGNFIQFATNNDVVYFSRLRNMVAWERAPYSWNVPIGEWHYYTYTYDGWTIRWYVDGVLRTSTWAGWSWWYDWKRWQWVNIFAERYSPSSEWFSWDIDDVAFFTRALSDSEISSLYSQSTAYDASGSSNHWTLVNFPTPKRRGGYKGWSFNGTSQSVSFANITGLRSFTATINPTANNRTILTIASGVTVSLSSSNTIVTAGLTGVSVRVNGSTQNVVQLNKFQTVTVTFDSVDSVSGNIGSSSFAWIIANLWLFDSVIPTDAWRNLVTNLFIPT